MYYSRSAIPHAAANRSAAYNSSRKGVAFSSAAAYSSSRPTVQRVLLGIGTLNTDAWDEIQAYALNKLQSGRDDLIHILKMRVKSKAPDQYQTLLDYLHDHRGEHAPASTTTVPANIHMVWIGGRISESACVNIMDTHKNLAEGFTLTLWTAEPKSDFLKADPGAKLMNLSTTHATNFKIKNADGLIDDRIKKTYTLALERDAYSMASDLIRYSVLLREGGIYMDVDVKMGSVNPTGWDREMSGHGLPMLGPNIRDKSARDEKLPLGLNELKVRGDLVGAKELEDSLVPFVESSFKKMFGSEPVAADDVGAKTSTLEQQSGLDEGAKTKLTAKTQYMTGNVANQFIAAPPAHAFIDYLIRKIGEDLEKRSNWHKDQVASLTGPSKFSSVISGYYASQYGVRDTEPHERRHLMDPHWLLQVVNLQWLTEESENQEMQIVHAPQSTISPMMAALVVGAVAVLSIYIYNKSKK